MTKIEQAACPEWARYVSPEELRPVDYTNSPPGSGHGHRLQDLAAGEEAWIISFGIFRDDRGRLWADGLVSRDHHEGETGTAHVVRTGDGIRVLTWPYGGTIKEQRPNRYGYGRDIWVVSFPTRPTMASCLICARNRPIEEMTYAPAETENGIEDEWTCPDGDPGCVPWIMNTNLGRSWFSHRAPRPAVDDDAPVRVTTSDGQSYVSTAGEVRQQTADLFKHMGY
jgi:hypothetical protein